MPLNPESPDVEVITGPLASLLRALWSGMLDAAVDAPVAIPRPLVVTWTGLRLDCADASWTVDAGGLDLELGRPKFGPDEQLDKMFRVMNQPAEITLEDGSTLTARLAHLISRGNHVNIEMKLAVTKCHMSLDSWTWWPRNANALWIGQLDGPVIRDGNLVVCGDDGSWTSTCYRLSGNYDLHLVYNRTKQTTRVVVDTRARKFDHSLLGADFMAMEFVLGRPLRLDHLLAVDEDHHVVGAAGLQFGGWTSRASGGRSPVAERMDLYANYEKVVPECIWIPVLFSLLATRLQREGSDSALLTAVAAYLDSIGAGNIHVSYLVVQVALEAFGAEITRRGNGLLVAESKMWLAFVDDHEKKIKSFARDESTAQKLVNKVRSAQYAPSTDRVAAALEHFGLRVPKSALDEIARRNSAAHNFVMAKESTADVQELADRLALVQTLLVAIIAKYVGFQGPIVGWEWIRGRHKIPEWWSWETLDEARRNYLVVPWAEERAVPVVT